MQTREFWVGQQNLLVRLSVPGKYQKYVMKPLVKARRFLICKGLYHKVVLRALGRFEMEVIRSCL